MQHENFRLLSQATGKANWCDGELHVHLADLRDVHDFRGAVITANPCDCAPSNPQTAEAFDKL